MYITCLDLEGVLVPEIWIAFAEESGIPELTRTTRDEPDYGKLMDFRLDILGLFSAGFCLDILRFFCAYGIFSAACRKHECCAECKNRNKCFFGFHK